MDFYLAGHISYGSNSYSGFVVLHRPNDVCLVRLVGGGHLLVDLCLWFLGGTLSLGD